ncbi:hypothetical protein KDM41_01245 [bacterium]|nr:hypothetical protein [bacterium]
MTLLRIILLILVVVLVRRLFATSRERSRRDGAQTQRRADERSRERSYGDLTDQGIDDADFEEIP